MENDGVRGFLRNFFTFIVEYEKKLILQRNVIEQLFCFESPFGFFKILDKKNKSYLNYEDLSKFLSFYRINYTQPQLKQIIKTYDLDGDHCWNFDEYLKFINNKKSIGKNFYKANVIKERELNEAIEHYVRELIKLFKIEIEFIQHIGIKIKGLKDVTKSESLNSKYIFDLLKQKNDAITNETLMNYINNGFNKFTFDDISLIIKRMSNGENFVTLRQLDNFLKFDKFITDEEIVYKRTEGYHKTNPIDNSNTLYYNIYARNVNGDSNNNLSFK